MIYHVLTEEAPFSEVTGGAISRWVANMANAPDHMVVCVSADSTWDFPAGKVVCPERLKYYRMLRRCHMLRVTSIFCQNLSLWVFAPLIKLLRKDDVVWIHNRPDHAAALAPLLKTLNVHVVLHMHNSLPTGLSKTQIAALSDVPTMFCSKFLIKEANSLYPGALRRTYHLYNGADDKLFFPISEERVKGNLSPTILFVGRLMPYKGAHVLLEAMAMLKKSGVNAFCKVYGASFFGGSTPNKYIRKLGRTCPTNARVEGYRSGKALAEEFRCAAIFCCPSSWDEPFGMVIIEAMASGVPVIASDVGGIPEALQYGGGVLVPANDATALASALRRLIMDSKMRKELGEKGLAAFQCHFSWTKIQERYLFILSEIAA